MNQKEEKKPVEVSIEVVAITHEDIKEAVKFVAELQKEYSCHCTLSVKVG